MNDPIDCGRYIERFCIDDEEVSQDIRPEQLLVGYHRDYHLAESSLVFLSNWLGFVAPEEREVRGFFRSVRRAGHNLAEKLSKLTGIDQRSLSRALFGLRSRRFAFRFRKREWEPEQLAARKAELRRIAADKLRGAPVRVLLTGGTGFLGKEIAFQLANDPEVYQIVIVIRPRQVKDRKTRQVIRTEGAEERGRLLLKELGVTQHDKFRFIEGDIEKPHFGIQEGDLNSLKTTLTHVIHCAASVAFDDPFEESYRANVWGSLNALRFSKLLQDSPDSPFVAHVAVETSYIHGRRTGRVGREDELVFPGNFYNNYYELTKALASLESERYLMEEGLRLVQICPSIVVGHSRSGNNRGDLKVANGPINGFGRAHRHLKENRGKGVRSLQAHLLYQLARIFPGAPTAALNLIPVDYVVHGIRSALKRPEAVGERIHLATDECITIMQMRDIIHQEFSFKVLICEPTLHRNLFLPVASGLLSLFGSKKLAEALRRVGSNFGGYIEKGQTVMQVGNDAAILGTPLPRPSAVQSFRMLCRHNHYVQEFGVVRDPFELARREQLWDEFLLAIEAESGQPAWQMEASEFIRRVESYFDLGTFEPRQAPARSLPQTVNA